jgi:hypothetical protein
VDVQFGFWHVLHDVSDLGIHCGPFVADKAHLSARSNLSCVLAMAHGLHDAEHSLNNHATVMSSVTKLATMLWAAPGVPWFFTVIFLVIRSPGDEWTMPDNILTSRTISAIIDSSEFHNRKMRFDVHTSRHPSTARRIKNSAHRRAQRVPLSEAAANMTIKE